MQQPWKVLRGVPLSTTWFIMPLSCILYLEQEEKDNPQEPLWLILLPSFPELRLCFLGTAKLTPAVTRQIPLAFSVLELQLGDRVFFGTLLTIH